MQPQELRPGDVVAGKFRVRSILSQNRGVLVEAFHTEFDQRVVIRLISPHEADEKEVERFRRESRVLAKLESEHAARIIDVGTQPDGSFYLVRQFLDGVDLERKLKQSGALPLWDAVLYILQAAEAVAETHAHGIILRELSTSHLFLTERLGGQPMVKLIDFGTAKLLRDENVPSFEGSEVTTTTMFGLSPYSSPELVRKEKRIDHRTDVWSLGAIFYELLTGRPPFGGDMALLMLQITKEQPAPIQSLRPDVPPNLVNVITRAMTKVVESRYQDVYAFAKALSPFTPSAGKVLIERIGALHKAAPQGAVHASAADDEEMEISQVEEISSLHSVAGAQTVTAAQTPSSLESVGVDDDDDDDAPTRIAFANEDTNSEVTEPKMVPRAMHRRPSSGAAKPAGKSKRKSGAPKRAAGAQPPPKKLSQEKTIPVGRSFVPVSPGPPPAPPPPKKPERPKGPVFAGAAAEPEEKTVHLNLPGPASVPEQAPPSSNPNLAPGPVRGAMPSSQPGALLGAAPGLEASPPSWPGAAPSTRAPTTVGTRHQTADNPPVGGGRRAVVLVIAAACVLLPGLLGVLIFKSEEGGDTPLASNETSAAVETTATETPTDTGADVEPSAGAGGAAEETTGSGGAGEAPDETGDTPPVATAPGPLPTGTAKGTGWKPPPPPPPPPSDTQKKPSSDSDKGKGTLVAIAVGGTCAFSVNGAAKGTTTTLKLSVKPGSYSVSCKPASGGTKSRRVRVKSGATAMAMFKL